MRNNRSKLVVQTSQQQPRVTNVQFPKISKPLRYETPCTECEELAFRKVDGKPLCVLHGQLAIAPDGKDCTATRQFRGGRQVKWGLQ